MFSVKTPRFHPSTPRGIDHIVAATTDLDGVADLWDRLGFRLTPLARHPWGTENRLVQFDGAFIEVLGLGAGTVIADPVGSAYSFGAYNRDFLARRGDGLSMLVLEGQGPDVDRSAFEAAGLETFDPFEFERIAVTPEGEERRVGFDLTFTAFPGAVAGHPPDMGFFTCHQRYPENFWRADYQRHRNTATGVAAVVLVAADPSDYHEGLSAFAGAREIHASSAGITIPTPRGAIEVLSPAAFRWRYGATNLPRDPEGLTFAGLRFAVADFGETAAQLIAGGFTVADRNGCFVVDEVPGMTIAFEPAA